MFDITICTLSHCYAFLNSAQIKCYNQRSFSSWANGGPVVLRVPVKEIPIWFILSITVVSSPCHTASSVLNLITKNDCSVSPCLLISPPSCRDAARVKTANTCTPLRTWRPSWRSTGGTTWSSRRPQQPCWLSRCSLWCLELSCSPLWAPTLTLFSAFKGRQ